MPESISVRELGTTNTKTLKAQRSRFVSPASDRGGGGLAV